jgi:hypothetical protein
MGPPHLSPQPPSLTALRQREARGKGEKGRGLGSFLHQQVQKTPHFLFLPSPFWGGARGGAEFRNTLRLGVGVKNSSEKDSKKFYADETAYVPFHQHKSRFFGINAVCFTDWKVFKFVLIWISYYKLVIIL